MRRAWILVVVAHACADPAAPAKLELSTPQVDFGPVELGGRPMSRAVALLNTGGQTLTLDGFTFETSSPDLSFVPPPTQLIEGGELATVRFNYAPTRPETVTATLTVRGPDVQRIVLRGWGATRGYQLVRASDACVGLPNSLAIGASDGRTPARQTLEIASTGSGPIRVGLSLDPPRAGLSVDSGGMARSLAPSEVARYTLTYDPAEPLDVESTIVLTTDSASSPGERIPICATARFPKLCVRPAQLDLGTAPAGTRLSGRLDLSSCGSEPLEVSVVEIAHGDPAHPTTAGFTVSSTLPSSLPPGVVSSARVQVTIPAGGAPSSGFVHVAANDPKSPDAWVPVFANELRPCQLVATPDPVALRAIIAPEQEVRVVNVGGGACVIDALTLSSASPALSLSRAPALPATVAPGGSLAFNVAYSTSSAQVSGRVVLHQSNGTVSSIAVTGDPDRPSECFLQPTADVVSFGLTAANAAVSAAAGVINHGRTSCRIVGAELDPSSDPRFSLSSQNNVAQVAAGRTVALGVRFRARGNTRASGRLNVETDDPNHPLLSFRLEAGTARCDDACDCAEGETLTLWRFDELAASYARPADGEDGFHRSCDLDRCEPGMVAVEVSRGSFECASPPPVCQSGMGLNYDEREAEPKLECVPCDVIVHYGGLYDFLTLCAESPGVTCGAGTVPTFDEVSRAWQCNPTCNNGAYDRALIDNLLVCVPC